MENNMKTTILATLTALALIAAPVFAATPNRTTMSFKEFVEASGCVVVDKGGYSNLQANDGGNCPFAVTQAFIGNYTRMVVGAGDDGVIGTSDDTKSQFTDN
jgi:hypothetical protein